MWMFLEPQWVTYSMDADGLRIWDCATAANVDLWSDWRWLKMSSSVHRCLLYISIFFGQNWSLYPDCPAPSNAHTFRFNKGSFQIMTSSSDHRNISAYVDSLLWQLVIKAVVLRQSHMQLVLSSYVHHLTSMRQMRLCPTDAPVQQVWVTVSKGKRVYWCPACVPIVYSAVSWCTVSQRYN